MISSAKKQHLIAIQKEIAKKVIEHDDFTLNFIGGVDISYTQNKLICIIVVLNKDGNIMEKKESIGKETLPYVPGFLAFREGPLIVETFRKLENKPDVLFVDGNGVLHPRKAGLASYVGIKLNTSTIGVTKKLLLGEVHQENVFVKGDLRAIKLETKKGAKPIYVSVGHKISLESAVQLVKEQLKGHKLPEPLRLAHSYVNKIKKRDVQIHFLQLCCNVPA